MRPRRPGQDSRCQAACARGHGLQRPGLLPAGETGQSGKQREKRRIIVKAKSAGEKSNDSEYGKARQQGAAGWVGFCCAAKKMVQDEAS